MPLAQYALAAIAALLVADAEASVLKPAVLPLAVRNPYFNFWLKGAREEPWGSWPIFWTGQEVGLSVLASVPDSKKLFPLVGRGHETFEGDDSDDYTVSYPKFVGSVYDASTTNLSFHIPPPLTKNDPLNVTISFASPITPNSVLRQSIPASYISIEVEGDFDIDIYIDINGQWVSGKDDAPIKWYLADIAFDDTVGLQSWQIEKDGDELFTEHGDRAEWGKIHFTGPEDVRFESGSAKSVRRRFAKTGTLQNILEQEFRRINEDEPVFAFHKQFNLSERHASDNVLFTLSHIQDEVVQFASARGLTYMRPLWKSWFNSEYSVLMFHYLDYNNAGKLAGNYSAQLAVDAYKAGGQNYVDNVALAARQVLGATVFSGTPDNPILFLKEISSNGNTQTVDVIFPSFPFFLYTNPRWLAYLLEPLLEHQLSGQYPNKYSMHDLGAHFPNMTGHADGNDEYMPVEECGDMLIMGLGLVNALKYRTSSDAQSIWATLGDDVLVLPERNRKGQSPFPVRFSDSAEMYGLDDKFGGGAKGHKQAVKWLENSYPIWKQWTKYLIESALEPANQLCTDDFAGWLPLQTNLALKGIIGIKAMSELAQTMGDDEEAKYYKNISDTYIRKWEEFGLSRDGSHAKVAYDWYGSWTTLYSLFADALLCFHPPPASVSTKEDTYPPQHLEHQQQQQPLSSSHRSSSSSSNNHSSSTFIPHHIYKKQSQWYGLSMQKYGLPLDSRHLYTKSDWQIEAAAVASPSVKQEIIDRMAKWLSETVVDRPFSDLYDTEGEGGLGAGNTFIARPVVGGHFSLLALDRACAGTAADGLIWSEAGDEAA